MTLYVEVHQTRTHEPTPYEHKLAAVLEEVYATGAHTLPELVRGLNERTVYPPDGGAWTEENCTAEIARLGA
ncbi:recombinase-like helix-turn-helix domain-containing protein [Streptomyces albidoflavus]|uniref:recombinase-like helix-turn-helix domain-containing protein n=1 Tax=Streptomyces TaxID=1883 RepID=UPI001C2DF2F1|nr:recombinase-like helix-turn-helix domain-containing protein [Streptomyces sp. BV333]MBV1953810.1 hypothetical protein [Streptomyces sp. BV333]